MRSNGFSYYETLKGSRVDAGMSSEEEVDSQVKTVAVLGRKRPQAEKGRESGARRSIGKRIYSEKKKAGGSSN